MIKNIWKDPVWSKVIATGILAAIVFVGTNVLGVWPTIWGFFNKTWDFIFSSTLTPNWLLASMAIPSILFLMALIVEFKNKFITNNSQKNFQQYTSDNFEGLLWSWHYSDNNIQNLHSLCPNCKYQILPKDASLYAAVPSYKYLCDDCGYSAGSFSGHPEELHQKTKLKIQKILRTGEWKNKTNF